MTAVQPPFPMAPMKGTSAALPLGDDWVYELKWDGMRIIAHIIDGVTRLQSSNGRDVSASFPELDALTEIADGHRALVLDGEVVAFADAKPSFNALQQRMHVADPAEAKRRAALVPVVFVVFDLLWVDAHDTRPLPLTSRRTLLEQVIDEPGPHWRLSEHHHDAPEALLDIVIHNELEGIMAKRQTSTYESGRRSSNWVKVKPRKRQEFVVGGWMGGRSRRAGGLGSLLVGYHDAHGDLRFAGRAGSGLSDDTIREWQALLVEQPACPFVEVPAIPREGRPIHWCVPEHVVEIAFGEWGTGHQLRHPVVLGRRADKDPSSVVRET